MTPPTHPYWSSRTTDEGEPTHRPPNRRAPAGRHGFPCTRPAPNSSLQSWAAGQRIATRTKLALLSCLVFLTQSWLSPAFETVDVFSQPSRERRADVRIFQTTPPTPVYNRTFLLTQLATTSLSSIRWLDRAPGHRNPINCATTPQERPVQPLQR